MNKVLRTFGLAAAVASTLALGSNPAAAQGGGGFAGDAQVDCFGCGFSDCHAQLTVAGSTHGDLALGAAVTGEDANTPCNANEPADVTCVITGTASGHVAGAINVDFNWTRVGATAVISTSGDINGNGSAVFVVTEPHGSPCGVAIQAKVAGVLVGT